MRGRSCINQRCIHSPSSARRHSSKLPSTYIKVPSVSTETYKPTFNQDIEARRHKQKKGELFNERGALYLWSARGMQGRIIDVLWRSFSLRWASLLKTQADFSHCLVGLLVQLVEQHIYMFTSKTWYFVVLLVDQLSFLLAKKPPAANTQHVLFFSSRVWSSFFHSSVALSLTQNTHTHTVLQSSYRSLERGL